MIKQRLYSCGVALLCLYLSACASNDFVVDDIKSVCETAADCRVFTACCDVYKACNETDLERCVAQEAQVCEWVDCVGACPNAPDKQAYQDKVQCINNVCTINPESLGQAWGCH